MTIVILSLVYVGGHVVKTVGSITGYDTIPHDALSMLGLVLIAIGTGGIKPCVSALAGDQFVLPQQQKQVARFFTIFYLCINLGAFLANLITPELRIIHCLGEKDCFPLAFGVPAAMMLM